MNRAYFEKIDSFSSYSSDNLLDRLERALKNGSMHEIQAIGQEVERDAILARLERFDGNKTKTAESLRIDRATLYARLKRYGFFDKSE